MERPELTEQQLAWLAADDRHCAGSDGICQGQHPHPRGYGAFARLAGQYLADGPAGYQRLVRHLATNAADAYGMSARGRLAPGMTADICVIGPDGMKERASYDGPMFPANGLDLVIVNGVIVWRSGMLVNGTFPGKFCS